MRSTLEDGLKALERAAREAESIQIGVDDQYGRWIGEIEARSENQSGTDKTNVWHAQRMFLELFKHARQVQPK